MKKKPQPPQPNPVSRLIKEFGGYRPMITALGEEHPNLVQSWERLGRIPHYRKPQILESARSSGVDLDQKLIQSLFPQRAA